MNNEKINSKIKLSNNSSFVILIFVIFKFRNIGRSTFRHSKFFLSFIYIIKYRTQKNTKNFSKKELRHFDLYFAGR